MTTETANKTKKKAPTKRAKKPVEEVKIEKTRRAEAPMQVVMRSVDKIKPYSGNQKRHDDKDVIVLARLIARFGFRQPIVVDANGVIIVGHARYAAAKKLNLSKVPVEVASDLSEREAAEYRLADNKSNELSSWDYSRVMAEIESLKLSQDDLFQLGFRRAESSVLLRAIGSDDKIIEEATKSKSFNMLTTAMYEVIVECRDEKEQASVVKQLEAKGHKCRLLMY